MIAHSIHKKSVAQTLAATNGRNLRTFLLMQQFEAQEIGARIQLARKERGLTQEELAEIASFSKRSLQDYEAGLTIPYRHFRELARLLKRPVEWFLYGDQEDAAEERIEQLREIVREEIAAVRSDLAEILALLEDDPVPRKQSA